jgi:ribosomal protein S20
VLAPRRSAAKTLVKAALASATAPAGSVDPAAALAEAQSALDRAAKVGAIHPNAAARRKSRLALKMNAALGGVAVSTTHVMKTVGRAAAQKAAKARIAAGKADKAKGAQTAAGKVRAALSKTARAEAAAGAAAAETATKTAEPKPTKAPVRAKTTAAKPAAKTAAPKPVAKTAAPKPAAKTTAKKPAAKKADV